MIASTARFVPSAHLYHRSFEAESALYDPVSGLPYLLEGTAHQIWLGITGDLTVGQIVVGLLAQHRIEPSRLQADVQSLLNKLLERNLIKPEY